MSVIIYKVLTYALCCPECEGILFESSTSKPFPTDLNVGCPGCKAQYELPEMCVPDGFGLDEEEEFKEEGE